jgi:alpha-D-xyloside xylohydrolase
VWLGLIHSFFGKLNPNTQLFWTKQIFEFHETIALNGLWLDMNEVSNFCSGITCSLSKEGDFHAQTYCFLVL